MNQFYFAQKAFILDGDRLLLVQKSLDDPHNPGKWEVPGGRMQFGEDVDSHLKREVREEVGIEVEPGKPFYLWQWQLERTVDGQETRIQIVAVARLCRPLSLHLDDRHRVDDDWLGEARWVRVSELEQFDFIANMIPVLRCFIALPAIEK
ncbi:MAG TPA: NUDIX domain-containing protein [Thermoanaerobaculia bacterium]|nr:NUDIX domain-containing protein [Thermoanaerobaculia bacterium]